MNLPGDVSPGIPLQWSVFKLASAAVMLVASTAAAQQPPSVRTPVLDLTLGRHTVSGGLFDNRIGALLDVLVAGNVRSEPRWSLIAAGGASGVVGGFDDRCLIRPGGGCAPKANFAVVDLLAGPGLPLGMVSARALVGPAMYYAEHDRSLGAQARIDLSSATRVGLGVMARATFLPSIAGQRILAWAVGGSIFVQ